MWGPGSPSLPRTHTGRQDLHAGLEWKEFWGAAVRGGEKSSWAGGDAHLTGSDLSQSQGNSGAGTALLRDPKQARDR